jgi:hypothetical protein
MNTIMLATIDPSALPALRIAGVMFLIIHLLAITYLVRNWRTLFGADSSVDGDIAAVRYLRVIVITIPLLFLTVRLVVEWVGLWIR